MNFNKPYLKHLFQDLKLPGMFSVQDTKRFGRKCIKNVSRFIFKAKFLIVKMVPNLLLNDEENLRCKETALVILLAFTTKTFQILNNANSSPLLLLLS